MTMIALLCFFGLFGLLGSIFPVAAVFALVAVLPGALLYGVSVQFLGKEGAVAFGGGIEIPPAADFKPGNRLMVARQVLAWRAVTNSTAALYSFASRSPICGRLETCRCATRSSRGTSVARRSR